MTTFDELAAMNERVDADRMRWKARAVAAEDDARLLGAAIQRVRAFCDQRDAEAQAFLGVVALKATARVTTDEIRECLDGAQ